MKLVIFDMDGVLFSHVNVWYELHKKFGTWEDAKDYTEKYLYSDYDKLVELVAERLWKGRDATSYLELVEQNQYNTGVKETIAQLHEKNYTLAIISSGPKALMERAQKELGIDDGFANDLVIEDGKIAGRARYDDGTSCWPVGADDKAPFVERLCEKYDCSLTETAFVGDSMADYKAFEIVGLPIAFNDAPEELIALAKKRGGHHVPGTDLREILQYF